MTANLAPRAQVQALIAQHLGAHLPDVVAADQAAATAPWTVCDVAAKILRDRAAAPGDRPALDALLCLDAPLADLLTLRRRLPAPLAGSDAFGALLAQATEYLGVCEYWLPPHPASILLPLTVADIAASLQVDRSVPAADLAAHYQLLRDPTPLPDRLTQTAIATLALSRPHLCSARYWRLFRDAAILRCMGHAQRHALAQTQEDIEALSK